MTHLLHLFLEAWPIWTIIIIAKTADAIGPDSFPEIRGAENVAEWHRLDNRSTKFFMLAFTVWMIATGWYVWPVIRLFFKSH